MRFDVISPVRSPVRFDVISAVRSHVRSNAKVKTSSDWFKRVHKDKRTNRTASLLEDFGTSTQDCLLNSD